MQSKENESISFCPKCGSYRIRTEIIKTRILVEDHNCYLHRSEWLGCNHSCTCVYEERPTLSVVCFYCLEKDRQRKIEEDRQREIEENKFSYKKWTTSTPQEKLTFYGMNKLKLLAHRKGITKLYKLTRKQQVIDILKPLVSENDFPIKID